MGSSHSSSLNQFVTKHPDGIKLVRMFKKHHPDVNLTPLQLVVLTAASPDVSHLLPKEVSDLVHDSYSLKIEIIRNVIDKHVYEEDCVDIILEMLNNL